RQPHNAGGENAYRAMSPEIDQLLCELGASLAPARRRAFEQAAHIALSAAGCSGVGAAYRLLRDIQRHHYDFPPDDRQANVGARHWRSSKLIQAEPIGAPDPREGARDRNRLKVV